MEATAQTQWEAIFCAAEDADEAKLDELVSQGVNLDVQIELGLGLASALHIMVEMGNTHGTELLIRKGANIEMTSRKRGLTALHLAAWLEHADLVQKLIELGANVHARTRERPDGSFSLPLHYVTQYGSDSPSSVQIILRHLLKHGGPSDFLIGDADGDTPLHCAALNTTIPHIVITELLDILASISDPKPSTSSVLDKKNRIGQTPFHHAVCNITGNLDQAADLLLKAGASKDACDDYGATPFHYAARSGNVYILDRLKLEDQDVDAPATKNQFTALHYAAWNNRHEAVEWLLKNGSSVNVTDAYKGDTPLHLAARRGHVRVIQTLIITGSADVLLTNKKGELALGMVDDRGYHKAAKVFVKAIREQNRQDYKHNYWQRSKHSPNSASLLHYFAAYGTEEDMEWILKVIKDRMLEFDHKLNTNVKLADGGAVNACDSTNRNAVHWAAMKGNKQALKILAQNHADLNADMNVQGQQPLNFPKTPLYLALRFEKKDFSDELMKDKKAFADELMKLKSESPTLHAEDWLRGISRRWMMDYYNEDEKLKIKLERLRDGFERHKYPPNIANDDPFSEIPPVYLALYAEREDMATFFQQHSKGEDDAVNERGKQSGRTSLHWATLLGQRKIVAQLCRKLFKEDLTANVEDQCGKTALQYAKELGAENEIEKDIEKELMQRRDVTAHIDGLYKDRQVYVDAANAILVGAALIAGVTFAGWLQPPLGSATYYNLPKLSVPPGVDAFQTYAAIQQHVGVRCFWFFNGLSFSFAIATVLAGLVAVVPIRGVYIATAVAHLRKCLLIAAVLLGSSIVFVLAAFAAAGFAVLPPLFKYQAIMLASTILGAVPCVPLLAWFCARLRLVCPEWSMIMEAKNTWMLLSTTAEKTCRKACMLLSRTAENTCNRLCKTKTEAGAGRPNIDEVSVPVEEDTSVQMEEEDSSLTPAPQATSTSTRTRSADGTTNESITPFQDDDYRVGDTYPRRPWDDGLNVSALI